MRVCARAHVQASVCVCARALTPRFCRTPRYEGMWRADKRHGMGKMAYVNDSGSVVESFEGEW